MRKRWKSKVDLPVGAFLAFPPLLCILAAIEVCLDDDASARSLLPAIPIAVLLALHLPVYYELGDDTLLIRGGIFRRRVPYGDIRRVTPRRYWGWGAALSRERLAIDLGSSWPPTISPRDRAEFFDALAAKTPHLRREGSRLVSR